MMGQIYLKYFYWALYLICVLYDPDPMNVYRIAELRWVNKDELRGYVFRWKKQEKIGKK